MSDNIDKVYNTGETESVLREKYNAEGTVLRQAQHRMTEMLAFLDDICKKNDIKYYIGCGTLLGAYRHGGFIPWDDDMDVMIDSGDMKKLRKIINSGNYHYVVQDHSVDKGFVRYYNVLRDLRSEYVKDEFQHNLRRYRGLQIDLFPYGIGAYQWGQKLVAKTMGLNERYFLGRHKVLSELVYGLTEYIIIPFLKFLSLFNSRKTMSYGYESVTPGYTYLTADVFPLSSISFEGLTVPCPGDTVAVLRDEYGDTYNELPPEDQRNQHSVMVINFYEDDDHYPPVK